MKNKLGKGWRVPEHHGNWLTDYNDIPLHMCVFLINGVYIDGLQVFLLLLHDYFLDNLLRLVDLLRRDISKSALVFKGAFFRVKWAIRVPGYVARLASGQTVCWPFQFLLIHHAKAYALAYLSRTVMLRRHIDVFIRNSMTFIDRLSTLLSLQSFLRTNINYLCLISIHILVLMLIKPVLSLQGECWSVMSRVRLALVPTVTSWQEHWSNTFQCFDLGWLPINREQLLRTRCFKHFLGGWYDHHSALLLLRVRCSVCVTWITISLGQETAALVIISL